jgi:PKD repeat protein
LTILAKPLAGTTTVSGLNTLCINQSGITYSISSPIPNVSTYKWIVPTGFSIQGFSGNTAIGTNLTSIQVNAGAVGGEIIVRGFNACNDSTADIKLVVTVQKCVLNFTPSTSSSCVSSEISFGNITSGASSYLWDFGAGAVPQTSNVEIPPPVKYSTPGLKTVKLTINAGIPGQELSKEAQIQINDIPAQAVLNNTETTICGSKTISVGVNPILGVNRYVWLLPSGWAFSTSADSNETVRLLTGTTGGLLSVAGKNECGTGLPASRIYTIVNKVFPKLVPVTGEMEVCNQDEKTYSVPDIEGYTFNWKVPEGIFIQSGQESSSIKVKVETNR